METQLITARVEKIVAGGYGLIRSDEGVILCRAVLPGELVVVKILQRQRGVAWGEAVEILEPSPHRVPTPCPWFPVCGGCDFMHAGYEAERAVKREMILETLKKFSGREIPVTELHPSSPLEYRNAIRLQGGGGYLGYCRKGSNDVVDVEDCMIARPEIREALKRHRAAGLRPVKSLTLRAGSDDSITSIATSHGRTEIDGGVLEMRLSGRSYRVSPRSFFQVNLEIAAAMIDDLKHALPDGPRLIDLFAGVGTFALALSAKYASVVGCEIAESAIEDFRHNARECPNVAVIKWDAASGLKDPILPGDVVIVDPPRLGLPPRLTATIAAASPRALAYISCDAATLARDLAKLLDAGYALAGPVKAYDMFPRTAHAEMVAVLQR